MSGDFKYISRDRPVREDRRFVVGKGRFAADFRPAELCHIALVTSPHAAAAIDRIDTDQARAAPGVIAVLTGADLAEATEPLMIGVDAPEVIRFPLAVNRARYAGEWVAAVIAETRALAEDAAELVRVSYSPEPFVLDGEEAARADAPLVHAAHGSNVVLDRDFSWGPVDADFAAAEHQIEYEVFWGRSATVPVETFAVLAEWDPWTEILDIRASIQMPKYADQIAAALRLPMNGIRVHQDVDVGGSYGVKRGIKHTVLAAHLARVTGRPVRLVEDRLENMRGGDMHGPERNFRVSMAFDGDGRVRSMKMRALDNVGAYTGRAPFQLGKPVSAIVGPYRIGSVRYHAIATLSNKTPQEAVRAFGMGPTNLAIEHGMDLIAGKLGLDRLEMRRRNFIQPDAFPYLIPSGTRYDSGDYPAVVAKVDAAHDIDGLYAERDRLRGTGLLAGLGIATCLEPSGGNSSFEPLLNPKNTNTTWMEGCRILVDATGGVTVEIHTTSAGQGHETLAATVVGETLGIDPERVRVLRKDSLSSLPGNSPVGSRMAIMLGGAAHEAAMKLRTELEKIASHDLGAPATYADGVCRSEAGTLDLAQLAHIAHRNFHRLPDGINPGLSAFHVMQAPTAGTLPDADGRVQMYPCYAFEMHLALISLDPVLGKPEIHRWITGHDCGTVINPRIVRGMTLGGIAHGIGAALMEEFAYDGEGQLQTQSFMDYLLPSAHEVPQVDIVHHCTPSPLTHFGQKGSGESGYLGAPAAILSALNDALAPRGLRVNRTPVRIGALSDLIAAARKDTP